MNLLLYILLFVNLWAVFSSTGDTKDDRNKNNAEELSEMLNDHFEILQPYFQYFKEDLLMFLSEHQREIDIHDMYKYASLCDEILTKALPMWYLPVVSSEADLSTIGITQDPFTAVKEHSLYVLKGMSLEYSRLTFPIPYNYKTDLFLAAKYYIENSPDLRNISLFLLHNQGTIESVAGTLLKDHQQELYDYYKETYGENYIYDQFIGPVKYYEKVKASISGGKKEHKSHIEDLKTWSDNYLIKLPLRLCSSKETSIGHFCESDKKWDLITLMEYIYTLNSLKLFETVIQVLSDIEPFLSLYKSEVIYEFSSAFLQGVNLRNTTEVISTINDVVYVKLDTYYQIGGFAEDKTKPSDFVLKITANRLIEKVNPKRIKQLTDHPLYMQIFKKYFSWDPDYHLIELLFIDRITPELKASIVSCFGIFDKLTTLFPCLLLLNDLAMNLINFDLSLSDIFSLLMSTDEPILDDREHMLILLKEAAFKNLQNIKDHTLQHVKNFGPSESTTAVLDLVEKLYNMNFDETPLEIIVEKYVFMARIFELS